MASERVLPLAPRLGLGRGWLEKLESRPVIWTGYAISATLTAAAIGLGSSPSLSGPLGPASPLVLTLLGANLALILALGGLIGWRVRRLIGDRPADAGARLHLRFVGLFAAAAVLPALIIALFFGVLVTRGVESWFNARVENVMEDSAKVATSYVEQQKFNVGEHAALLAQDLNSAGPSQLARSPVAFSQFLTQQAADNGFTAAYVIDGRGRVLAAMPSARNPVFLVPPAQAFGIANDEVAAEAFETSDLIRGLYRLRGFPDAYLYVDWPVEPGVFSHLDRSSASISDYRAAKASRERIQFGFFLSYFETVLLVLIAAVSFGMSAASRISEPIARLVQAAGHVAAGDLTVRVETESDPEEL